MAPPLRLDTLRDFTGGLNVRADPFELNENESPDMLNVDPDPRGGVELRRGISPMPLYVATPNILFPEESTFDNAVAPTTITSSGTVSHEKTILRRGQGSLKFASTATSSYFFIPGRTSRTVMASHAVFPVEANQRYAISMWFRHGGGTNRSLSFTVRPFTAAGVALPDIALTTMTSTSAWQQAAGTVTMPATAAFIGIWVYNVSGAAGDNHYFDDIAIIKGAASGTWLEPDMDRFGLDSYVISAQRFQVYGQYEQMLVATYLSLWKVDFVQAPTVINGVSYWNASLIAHFGDAAGFQFRNGNNTNKAYIPNLGAVSSWDGVNHAYLTNSFNDNYNAPTYNNMPLAKLGTQHGGCAWLAHTKEAGVEYPNRVRFSHVNSAGDWRSFDYIDIEPGMNGDYIVALVPFKDRLLVFKRSSIFAIIGNSPENFAVIPVARDVGATNENCVVATEDAVYFFHWPMGVMRFDGRSISWEFSRLSPLIDRGQIDYTRMDLLFMGWSPARNRLWLSVPWKAKPTDPAPTYPTRTYILDPSLGKSGAWTQYDLKPQKMWNMTFTGLGGFMFATLTGSLRVFLLDWPGDPAPYDYFGDPQNLLSDESSSFEGGTVGSWSALTNCAAPTVNSSGGSHGTRRLVFSSLAAGNVEVQCNATTRLPVIGGLDHTVLVDTMPLGATARSASVVIYWYDNGGTLISSTVGPAISQINSSTWKTVAHTATAPANALTAKISLRILSAGGASETHLLDKASFHVGQNTTWMLPSVSGQYHIQSWYMTRWIDQKAPAIIKRWKRSEFVLRGGKSYDLVVNVYRDYDPQVEVKRLNLHADIDTTVLEWGDDWGGLWGPAPDISSANKVVRGGPIGQARSIAMKINGPTENTNWGMNAVTVKFIPKPPRN